MGFFLSALLNAYFFLILARVIGSYFVRDWSRGIARLLWDFTEPVLAPARRLIPPMGGFDLSPMVVCILLQVLSGYVRRFP
jgi:YggT family protein